MTNLSHSNLTIVRLERRRQEILEELDLELRIEFQDIETSIATILRLEAETAAERKPLEVHKANLIEWLTTGQVITRSMMTTDLGIPRGSISELLKCEEFEQRGRGLWGLKETGKQPDAPEITGA